ncbi:MAG TPA: pentapeptide repeat-containing protein, partial [Verrucomicrobiae bacterium]|nr:pentapeptide repeat-containing protein [Verrucomicrobiae bacterium]
MIHSPHRLLPIPTLLLAMLPGLSRPAHAQADLRVSVQRHAPNELRVSWVANSLVPLPGNPAFAGYRVLTSVDLTHWTIGGEIISGLDFPNETIQRDFPVQAENLFAKVESLLNFDGLDLIQLPLANANFARASFVGCDFFGANLTRANLSEAHFEASDFHRAVLSDATLANGHGMGAIFSDAILDGLNATNANLSFCDFNGANLSGANFAGADLRFSIFVTADADFIGLQRTLIDEHTVFSEKIELVWKIVNHKFADASITNRDLTLCNLAGANLENTIFGTADLRGCDLQNANLAGAMLLQANLDFVDFRGTALDARTRLATKPK